MSPGFTPRPWLSGHDRWAMKRMTVGVAGVYAPALVERASVETSGLPFHVSPGFTPRPWLSGARPLAWTRPPRVSPGFTPRPWLSGQVSVSPFPLG